MDNNTPIADFSANYDYKTRISKLEAKFNEMEDRYYKQFTAMEKAMANMQSQQNSLASYLGG